MTTEKRISPDAYQALREALPVVFHYKRPFESFLRSALRDHPELLAGVNFGDLKRYVADEVVQRLVRDEARNQQTTIDLMVAVAGMERFPDLERHEDAEYKLAEARRAVEELRRWTEPFVRDQSEQQEAAARREVAVQQAAALREFTDDLRGLEAEFLAMHESDGSPQDRGRRFQTFLTALFELFDLEPRLAYSLESEQIDGSVTFDTDDYIVEARWRRDPVEREDADVFATKVRRKGKNALGLFVSVSGFTRGALDAYSQATPFMAMDGVQGARRILLNDSLDFTMQWTLPVVEGFDPDHDTWFAYSARTGQAPTSGPTFPASSFPTSQGGSRSTSAIGKSSDGLNAPWCRPSRGLAGAAPQTRTRRAPGNGH